MRKAVGALLALLLAGLCACGLSQPESKALESEIYADTLNGYAIIQNQELLSAKQNMNER